MRVGLQWKVLGGYLGVTVLSLAVAGWLALTTLQHQDMEQLRIRLADENKLAAELFRPMLAGLPASLARIDSLADRLGDDIHARITVIAADGTVLGDSYESGEALSRMDNHLSRPEIRQALESDMGASVRMSGTVGIRMFNLALAVKSPPPDRRLMGFVRVSLPLTEIEARHRTLRNALIAALAAAFVLSLGVSYLVARGVTRPLAEMVAAANRMVGGEFHPRIRPRSNDEVADLAGVLNRLAASIEETIDSLREDRAKMAATLTAMQEGVMVLSANGTILLTNPAMLGMLGRQEADVIERNHLEVIRQPRLNELIAKALGHGGLSETEIELGAGLPRIFHVRASTLQAPDRARGLVLVFHDITNLRHLEQVRRDFVANVSHELRTPLTAIKGYVEALQDAAQDNPEQRGQFLDVIHTHTDRLNLIITDLLLLSKIESGQIPLKQEPVDLAELMDRTAALFMQVIQRKRHTLTINVPEDLPPVVGDDERLGQVFSNLLDNAIKYTPEQGAIIVSAGMMDGMAEVRVEDTGIGIPPKDLPRIFERFYRVDKARSRELGGTGLGLAIVKHLVEAHGGTVSAESHGAGSRFTVRLPIERRP